MGYQIQKKTKKGSQVKFKLQPGQEVQKIELAGDFTDWQQKSVKMRKSNGAWTCNVSVTPGKHEYKFLVDGQWWTDPENIQRVWNNVGAENSVLNLE